MHGLDTSPDLMRLKTEGLMSYFHDSAYQLEGAEEIQRLAPEQEKLGWHQFLLGSFPKKKGMGQITDSLSQRYGHTIDTSESWNYVE
jgi:hypothetical protein